MLQKETVEEKAIVEIGERYSALRIVNPLAEAAMEKSLQKYGQMSPVICARTPEGCELVDGFKRLRVFRKLNQPTMKAVMIESGDRVCKAAIIQLNRVGKSITDIEEALVLRSLFREDGLTQVEIATLLGRHKSWVSRRISLVERLSEEVLSDICLGLLSVSIGREVLKLPRGNQMDLVRAIQKYRLKKRDVEKLVAYLLTQPSCNYSTILYQPWEVLKWEKPLPSGFEGKLIALRLCCQAVVERFEGVSREERERLSRFITDAQEAANQAAAILKSPSRF